MYKDFEGKTKEDAIEKAIKELNLGDEKFDVEILEENKGIFKKSCKVRVYYGSEEKKEENEEVQSLECENETEEKVLSFLQSVISKMGYQASVTISNREEGKLTLYITTEDMAIIIGRDGKNLDALQVVTNSYCAKFDPDLRVVVECENYRVMKEDSIIRSAYNAASQVKRSGRSVLLKPMNPFERRLVHTALNEIDGIDTKSEGEGTFKRVRVIPINRK